MKLKTIIIISFIFLITFSIYLTTIDRKIYYLNIGDNLSIYNSNSYSNQVEEYLIKQNKLEKKVEFIDVDYRTTDLIRDIKDNKTIMIDNKNQTLKNALIKADLVTISVGKNDIYYKLSSTSIEEIYDYVDETLKDIKQLLNIVKEYCKEDIILIGIIDDNTNYPEVIDYANEKIKRMCENLNIKFIDANQLINDDSIENGFINEKGNKKIFNEIKKLIENYILK